MQKYLFYTYRYVVVHARNQHSMAGQCTLHTPVRTWITNIAFVFFTSVSVAIPPHA
jgi:hypothetical protein